MGTLTAKEVEAKAKGKVGRFADGDGFYFVVPKSGKPHWITGFIVQYLETDQITFSWKYLNRRLEEAPEKDDAITRVFSY